MFWKRNSQSPPDTPAESGAACGPLAPAETGAGAGREARDLDAAMDTVVALLRAFGEHAFDTDNVSAKDTQSECDGWARRIALGERVGGEGGPPKRDFG